MLHFHNTRRYWNSTNILILFLLTLLCFWPITFGIFSAKNDNITQFLPVRFHVSEALRNWNLPLWTPYMYLGYPIHGDMQGGAWNPVVWLISFFGRYNLYSIHAEILTCIFIAGAGMYRLIGIFTRSSHLQLIGACSYLMCGYITDSGGSNLPFLWGAAYTPFVFAYYYQLLTTPSYRFALKAGTAMALLFVSAYPSFFIQTCYILFAGALFYAGVNYYRKKINIKPVILTHLVCFAVFCCFAAPAIVSYLHILQFYQRGDGVSLANAMVNSLHPSCIISTVLPQVPFKNPVSFSTDLISRNLYFNIFLAIFLTSYFRAKKTLFLNFVCAGILFFLLFSLGDLTPVRALSYKFLPLMDTFRHPANARLYVIIGSILVSISVLHQVLSKNIKINFTRILTGILMSLLIVAFVISLIKSDLSQKIQSLWTGNDPGNSIKNFFTHINVYDVIVMNGVIQITFLAIFLFLQRAFSKKWLSVLFIANSFAIAQLCIPYTIASKTPPAKINTLLNSFPKGYPLPDTNSIRHNSRDALSHFQDLGISGFYSKKMTLTDAAFTPTFMRPILDILNDSLTLSNIYLNPYAYFATSQSITPKNSKGNVIVEEVIPLPSGNRDGVLQLKKLTNNRFHFTSESKTTQLLCLQQLRLPGWKCQIDNKEVDILSANHAFMAVVIPEGKHNIRFIYQPPGIRLSILLFISGIFIFIFFYLKKDNYGKKK